MASKGLRAISYQGTQKVDAGYNPSQTTETLIGYIVCCVLPFLFINLFIINPCVPPNIIVIIKIGSNEIGSFQPIRMALGNNTRNAIRMPLIIEFTFKSDLAVKNPTIIHIDKAEIFASQVNF
jgi:hypothetical protein